MNASSEKKFLTLRSSGLPQFMTCAPSELNPDKLQEVFIEIEPAELGTLVHEFAQRIVETGEWSVDELQARRPDDMERAELLIRNFFTVWDEARQVMTAPQTEVFHEMVLVDNDTLQLKLSGHIDLCQIVSTDATILDYKTGRLHENHYHQIAGYAALAWDKAGRPAKYKVAVSVVYLEDLSITNYDFTAADLEKWLGEVVAKVSDTRYTVGKKCAFCKIQGSCPAYREYTSAAIRFFQSEDAQMGRVKWKDVEPAERGSLVDVMYVVSKGAERVKDSLKSVLQGSKKSAALDLGDGMGYTKVIRRENVLDTQKALPLLRRRFAQDLLDEITTIKLSDLLGLVAKHAAKGAKQKAKDEFLARLDAAGAIQVNETERFERRPLGENKLEAE